MLSIEVLRDNKLVWRTVAPIRLLMEEIRWANIALEASLASSEDHTLVVNIFSLEIQLAYISTNALTAFCPAGVSSPPIKTRSDLNRSLNTMKSYITVESFPPDLLN